MQAKPFLRWAGGKQKLVNLLLPFIPSKKKYERYFEPFFGAGALFFATKPDRSVISDINTELINCYQQVAKVPHVVAEHVKSYAQKNSKEFFYEVRSMSLDELSREERAARFIYLNKAAFNGIYRVNKAGQFNVPYGPSSGGPAIPSLENLKLASECLNGSKIFAVDFEEALADAKKGDFIYLDPPYPPLSNTANFNHYSADRFKWDEQIRVSKVFKELSDRGCLVMLTNSDQEKVVALYDGFIKSNINVTRWLGSNGDRFKVSEVVITNYNPAG